MQLTAIAKAISSTNFAVVTKKLKLNKCFRHVKRFLLFTSDTSHIHRISLRDSNCRCTDRISTRHDLSTTHRVSSRLPHLWALDTDCRAPCWMSTLEGCIHIYQKKFFVTLPEKQRVIVLVKRTVFQRILFYNSTTHISIRPGDHKEQMLVHPTTPCSSCMGSQFQHQSPALLSQCLSLRF